MTDFERIKILTGERDEELVEVVLEDATDWVLAYTGRKKMIPELKKTVRDLAVIAINAWEQRGNLQEPVQGNLTTLIMHQSESMMC